MRVLVVSLAAALSAIATLPSLPDRWPVVVLRSGQDHWGQGCRVGAVVWTAAHVVEGTTISWVEPTGEGAAEVLWRDTKHDVARVRIEGQPLASPLNPSFREFRPGEHLRTIATDFDGTRLVIHGFYLFTDDDGDVIIDGFSMAGMSGGCVVDDDNAVVAILKGTSITETHSRRPVAFAAPAKWFK